MAKGSVSLKSIGVFEVGGISHTDLRDQAKERGDILWTSWADHIMDSTPHLSKRFSVEVYENALRVDLPRVSKGKTLRPMYEEAIQNGFCLCPASLGFEILLQKTKRGFKCEAFLAMKPVSTPGLGTVTCQPEILSVTDKGGRYSKSRFIHVTPACLDSFADGGHTYLLCRRNTHLVKAGFAKIDF